MADTVADLAVRYTLCGRYTLCAHCKIASVCVVFRYRYLAVTSCEWRRFSSRTSLSLSYSSGTDPEKQTNTLHFVALKVKLLIFKYIFDTGLLLTVVYY